MGSYWMILLLPAFFGSSHGDCGAPPRLEFTELNTEFVDKDNFSIGANVTYKCQPGFTQVPGDTNVVTCLSNSTWSTPKTFCNRRSCGYPGDISNGETHITDTLFGSRVTYTCNLGYKMISRRDFRDCQADGIWSNAPPECAVQTCPPPDATTDGSFQPDQEEYEYQNAVIYACNNKSLALIGPRSLSCTAFGNWSSDAPKCKEVECSPPDVPNSEKLSGFRPPYIFNSAVRFRCLPDYTMIGESSVTCNAKSEWEPPLPVCNRIVTPSPETTKENETGGIVTPSPSTTKEKETGESGIVTQSPSTTKEKETGDGSNVGAVVGGVIAGIFGVLFAASAIIYVCWFKKKRGGGYVAPTRKHPDSGTSSSHQAEPCDMKQIETQETH